MKFENALVAMRKGYKIHRKSDANRYFYLKEGIIMHHKPYGIIRDGIQSSFAITQIMADDWRAFLDNNPS